MYTAKVFGDSLCARRTSWEERFVAHRFSFSSTDK
jgi:hypothetical protein